MSPYHFRSLLVSSLVCLQFFATVERSHGQRRSDEPLPPLSHSLLIAQQESSAPPPATTASDPVNPTQTITQVGALVGERLRQEDVALVAQEKPSSSPKPDSAKSPPQSKKPWMLAGLALVAISSVGALLLRISRRPKSGPSKPEPQPAREPLSSSASPGYRITLPSLADASPPPESSPPIPSASASPVIEEGNGAPPPPEGSNGHRSSAIVHTQAHTPIPASDEPDSTRDDLAVGEISLPVKSSSEMASPQSELAIGETTRIAKPTIGEELIRELQSVDRTRRSRAIWELGQRGDSHAVQPLVDLLLDSDSKQRSLILASLSEIGVRTLKPLNRALTIGLQDENAEVRKNAIRDLTRVYDLIGQITQLLRHAAQDPDPEVQETARWALNQVGRIRAAAGVETSPSQPPFSGGTE